MTLNWTDGLTKWVRRRRGRVQPAAIELSQTMLSNESDSDFGIDEIDEDTGLPPVKSRAGTADTLCSNPDLVFPSLERRDTWDSSGSLTEGLDPALLFDEDKTFNLDSMGSEFTLGGAQRLHLLDAVEESDESDGDMTETSPTPELLTIRSKNSAGVDPLDGINYMLDAPPLTEQNVMLEPTPPTEPKSNISSTHRRVKQTSQQSDKSDQSDKSAVTTDTEFYVISDEDIRAVDDEMDEMEVSFAGSSSSITQRLSGRIRQLSGTNPKTWERRDA